MLLYCVGLPRQTLSRDFTSWNCLISSPSCSFKTSSAEVPILLPAVLQCHTKCGCAPQNQFTNMTEHFKRPITCAIERVPCPEVSWLGSDRRACWIPRFLFGADDLFESCSRSHARANHVVDKESHLPPQLRIKI